MEVIKGVFFKEGDYYFTHNGKACLCELKNENYQTNLEDVISILKEKGVDVTAGELKDFADRFEWVGDSSDVNVIQFYSSDIPIDKFCSVAKLGYSEDVVMEQNLEHFVFWEKIKNHDNV